MKFLNLLFVIILSSFCMLIVSCIKEEADQCVNALDCVNGFVCVDGVCVDPEGPADDKDSIKNDDDQSTDGQNDSDISIDFDQIDDSTNDTGNNDTDSIFPDEDDSEKIDEIQDADMVVDCDPGYHYEAEGDDENGDGDRGCVKNVTCITEPCNGGQCTELEFTVECDCQIGYAGRWCADCDTGYLKSTVDDKCKPDCDNGTYSCTGTKECGVDPVKNEAGCICKEFFSGADCTTCDPAHFCSSHGSCAASGVNAVCTCDTAWTGNANCSTCTTGYLVDGANCIPGCKNYCGHGIGIVPEGTIIADSNGTCSIVSGTATCTCDAGWKTVTTYTLGGIIKPACSDCDTANPPVGGCPE